MPRRVKVQPKQRSTADELAQAFTGGKPSRRSQRRAPPKTRQATINKYRKEILVYMAADDWSLASSGHLLALYAYCHEKVYGVEPEVIQDASAWTVAANLAKGFLTREFKGDVVEAVAFMRWVWKREQFNEKKNIERNVDSDWRLPCRYQFTGKRLTTDYQVAKHRDLLRGKRK